MWSAAFVRGSGWSNNDTYPRMLVDVNGDGLPDVVGFATGGVYVALDTGTSFSAAKVWNTGYGNDTGWTSNSRNPRMLVNVNGDGLPDIVGFADGGVTVSLNSGSSFGAGQLWYGGFGAGSGWNNDNIYPRFVLDVLGTGFAGVVGFAGAGVQVATNTASVLP